MSLIHAWKCQTSKLWNHLGRGLWNIKETFSILSSWDHKYKSKQSIKEGLESIKGNLKEVRYSWSLSFEEMNLIWFKYAYEF